MYLVFDIGGTFIKHAVMDSAGTIISKAKRPTPKKSLNDLLTCLFSVIAAEKTNQRDCGKLSRHGRYKERHDLLWRFSAMSARGKFGGNARKQIRHLRGS